VYLPLPSFLFCHSIVSKDLKYALLRREKMVEYMLLRLHAEGFERFHYESSVQGNQVLISSLNLIAIHKMSFISDQGRKIHMLADDILASVLGQKECLEDNECDSVKGMMNIMIFSS
jgi:hypothetical protein